MRLSLALLAGLAFAPGCDTTQAHAQVPTIEPHEAVELVTQDLAAFADAPSETRWLRAYRHFDVHLEPHVGPARRLQLELSFAELRRALKMSDPDGTIVRRLASALADDLQPQD